jgi:hypothetical protein
VSGFGAVATAIVFVVILTAKFAEGAWVIVILIPVVAFWAWLIGRFYKRLRRSLNVAPDAVIPMEPHGESRVPVVVPVEDVNLATVMTVAAACGLSRRVIAVHVIVDPDAPSTVEDRWNSQFPNVPLVLIESPYRTAAEPIAAYVDDLVKRAPYEVTVLVPVLEVPHWYQRPLVNQSLKRLRGLLAQRRQVSVQSYPFGIGSAARRGQRV